MAANGGFRWLRCTLSKDEAAAARSGARSRRGDLPVVFGPIAVTYNLNSVSSLS